MANNVMQIAEYYHEQDGLLDVLTHLANAGTYVFRGYSIQNQLYPQIIRGEDFSNVEYDLLDEFEKYGSHYFTASTPIDFLSYGQHYGLPTRLLDFTFNPFIALSFALYSQKPSELYESEENRDYYYIRYCDILENIHLKSIPIPHMFTWGHYESGLMSKECIKVLSMYSNCLNDVQNKYFSEYIQGLYECDYQPSADFETYKPIINEKVASQKLCFIDPNQSNQRIIMQQGLFMLPYTLDKSKHQEIFTKNTSVIKIHRDLREPLLRHLDTLGYNTFRLMPDLPSICAAVTQRVKDRLLARN